MPVLNINLQKGIGGGEVYTGFFLRALDACGINSQLIAHPDNTAWGRLAEATLLISASAPADLLAVLAKQPPSWLIFHTLPSHEILLALKAQGHYVTCFAHMPMYQRNPQPLTAYDAIFPVSGYVLDTLLKARLTQAYPVPLYGVADLRTGTDTRSQLAAHSPFDWDRRKFREQVLGALEPFIEPFISRPMYSRRSGVVLGIASRITTIKQFPLLFSYLAPVLSRHPNFHVEIFGAGGYASVRDLRRALAPIADRVRFWGHQSDMAAVYKGVDYLLTGLPEKEALGLNVIEAQACGCPVLAVDSPPFTETVAPEVSGLMYLDPRKDNGTDFEKLLVRLETEPFKIDQKRLAAHLVQFGEAAFIDRVNALVNWIHQRMGNKG